MNHKNGTIEPRARTPTISSGTFDLARPRVSDEGHRTGRTALALVAMAAAIRTIWVSTAPCLQTGDDFVAWCLPFPG